MPRSPISPWRWEIWSERPASLGRNGRDRCEPWLVTAIVVGSGVVLYLILAGMGARFVDRVEQRTPGSAARVLTGSW